MDPVYLLLGPEEGEKDLFVKKVIESISKTRGEKPEVRSYYPFEGDLVTILAQLRNGTLFCESRVLIIKNIEEITKKRDIDLLLEYCDAPAAQATLLLLSNEIGKINKRLEKKVPPKNRKIFWELFDNQKMGWIFNFFKKRNIDIDKRGAAFLLDMVENNTRELREIGEKLALYFGEGSRIDMEKVESIIYHSKEENVFTLFDRVAHRTLDSAAEVLYKIQLSREADPVQLLAGLLYQFRKLITFVRLLQENFPRSEAFNKIAVRSKRVQRVYAEGASLYSLNELETIIRLIACFDIRLRAAKSSRHGSLLQLFLYYLVHNGGRGAWMQTGA